MQRILPYAFTGLEYLYQPQFLKNYNYISALQTTKLNEDFLPEIPTIYQNLLLSMKENDTEYLKSIMEGRLFHATTQCLEALSQQGIKLQYLENQDAPELSEDYKNGVATFNDGLNRVFGKRKLQFLTIENDPACIYAENDFKLNIDAKGVFGPRIERKENEGHTLRQLFAFQTTPRIYYINFSKLSSIMENQILVLNVLIQTSKKLIATNSNTNELVYGTADYQLNQFHKIRFETYIPDYNWVITDIDDYMKGNPYDQ